jgi:cellulose synthase/poly-beta-1,6-N-acetylglucosamine synthase-like glycosyltransferase
MEIELLFISICGISALAYLLQILTPYISFMKKSSESSISNEPVSVIICARNEGENLLQNLPSILLQDYPTFEVIVIDDASWDSTGDVLNEFKANHKNLSVVTITEEQKRTEGKKMALTLGIKKAQYENLLFTDADCIPVSSQWIKVMSTMMSKGIVLGYGEYKVGKGLLNKLVRFDSWSSAVHYLGMAAKGRPYIGVGRNLGYKKTVYGATGGFRTHYHIISGDDDLFVNQAARKENTRICIEKNAFTRTDAPQKWSTWTRKKTRHLSSSRAYSTRTKRMLFMKYASLSMFYLTLTAGLILSKAYLMLGILFLVKTLIHMLISLPAAKRLAAVDVLVLLPMLEPLNLVINTYATIKMKWSKTIPWN